MGCCCSHDSIPTHEKKFENKGVVKFNWFMSIFDWIVVALMIFCLVTKDKDCFIASIITHVFFISVKFITTFIIYFFREYPKGNEPIFTFINSRPEIFIVGICSHEGTIQLAPDEDEKSITVISRVEKKKFEYYSSRDISGKINLSESAKKSLIVEISYEYKFADEISNRIFIKEKMKTNNKIAGLDKNSEIQELIKPHNYPYETEKYLINRNPIFINRIVYTIFTLLSFGEIYKLISYSLCEYKEIKIIKIISSVKDITIDEYYNEFDPIIITDEVITPDPEKYKFKNEKFNKINLPHINIPRNELKFNNVAIHIIEDVNFGDNKSDINNNKNKKNLQLKKDVQNNSQIYLETQNGLNIDNLDKII